MVKTGKLVFLSYGERRKGLGEKAPRGGKMKFGESKKYFRGMFSAVLLCLTVSAARAWIYDPSKPLIYEMRIAFETDKWINMYSTATVLSKSDNAVAFRVVADSTVTPTYQLVVTTQGNVGIGTANPAYLLDLNGTANGKQIRINTSGSNGPSIGFNQDGTQHAVVGLAGAFQATTNRDLGFLSDTAGTNISFFTNGNATTPKVIISSNGNVGISTASPASLLDVNGTAQLRGSAGGMGLLVTSAGNVGVGTASPNAKLYVIGDMDVDWTPLNSAYTHLGVHGGGISGFIGNVNNRTLYLGRNGTADVTILASSGNVGIGSTSPGYLLTVNGSAAKPGGGSWTDSSDSRLKKNVKPVENALDKLLSLKGVSFEWIEPQRAKLLPGPQMGMIAQEVEKVFPQWVGTDANGYKDLTYRGFEALAVEAIRELKAENESLKQRIKNLEAEKPGK